LGFTFKENCPDVRNTRVIDIVDELKSYQAKISIYDPWAEPDIVKHEYGIETFKNFSANPPKYDAVILAVAHSEFDNINVLDLVNKRSVIYDVKSVLNQDSVDARL
jgi:UDP-N-acetyl-D-galactosamine dehydrogenase